MVEADDDAAEHWRVLPENLVEQIEISEFRDEHEHSLKMFGAYIEAVTALAIGRAARRQHQGVNNPGSARRA